MTPSISFERYIELVRDGIRQATAKWPVKFDIMGRQVSPTVWRFASNEPGTYCEAEHQGPGRIMLTMYDNYRPIGSPLLMELAVVTEPDSLSPQGIHFLTGGELPEGFAAFLEGCQREGERLAPAGHPELFGLVFKNGRKAVEFRTLPFARERDLTRTIRRANFVLSTFLDIRMRFMAFAFKSETPGQADTWLLALASHTRHMVFLNGPYMQESSGRRWVVVSPPSLAVGMVLLGDAMQKALRNHSAPDLMLGEPDSALGAALAEPVSSVLSPDEIKQRTIDGDDGVASD